MKYLKLFDVHTDYEEYINTGVIFLPNVSLCKQENNVHYNHENEESGGGSDEPVLEGNKILCKYNVTDTDNPINLFTSDTNNFSSIIVDGDKLSEVTNEYTFDTTGEHTVLFILEEGETSISDGIFSECPELTSVIIGNSVESIGESAFYDCYGLTNVTIGNSVTSIGNSAFYGCYGLTSVTISNSVTSIGSYTFYGCSGLTSITIPDSVTYISESAFQDCSGLTSVTIGNSVESIGNQAFQDCSGLTSVIIPDSVTYIGNSVFQECSGLTSVTIGNSTELTMSDSIFQDCSGLTSITCNAITAPTISPGTFYNIKSGGELTTPAGSTGYDVWMGTDEYYLGYYGWTKVEQ